MRITCSPHGRALTLLWVEVMLLCACAARSPFPLAAAGLRDSPCSGTDTRLQGRKHPHLCKTKTHLESWKCNRATARHGSSPLGCSSVRSTLHRLHWFHWYLRWVAHRALIVLSRCTYICDLNPMKLTGNSPHHCCYVRWFGLISLNQFQHFEGVVWWID